MVRPSEKRKHILEFIKEFIGRKGYSPSIREILDGCHIHSTALVQHHLGKLEEEGLIRRDPDVSRSIQLTRDDSPLPEYLVEIPLLGVIAAGEPIPVPDSDSWMAASEEVYRLPAALLRNKHPVFALTVKGTSMTDALIADGDTIVLEPVQKVENGQTAAVWLRDEQEVTLKKVYYEKDCIRLQPANPLMAPIFSPAENVQVQGKLIAVIRESR